MLRTGHLVVHYTTYNWSRHKIPRRTVMSAGKLHWVLIAQKASAGLPMLAVPAAAWRAATAAARAAAAAASIAAVAAAAPPSNGYFPNRQMYCRGPRSYKGAVREEMKDDERLCAAMAQGRFPVKERTP